MSREGKSTANDHNEPLTHHVEQELSVGQRLSSFFSDRCEMPPPMSRDDSCAATHASEHSSIFLIGRSAWGRGMRQAEWGRRREKEGEKIGKGKRGGDIGERYLRGRDHEYPFLPPVPKTHGYGCPHTKQYYAAACAVVRSLSVLSPCVVNAADTDAGCVWMRRT